MKLFFITSRFPYPLEKGDKLRVYYQLKVLSRHCDIHLFTLSESALETKQLQAIEPFCKSISCVQQSKWSSINSIVKGALSKLPMQTRYFYSRELEFKLQQAYTDEQPDHVHYHLIRTTQYLRQAQSSSSIDLMDSFSLGLKGLQRKRKFLPRFFYGIECRLVKAYERSVVQRFGQSYIISTRDRDYIDPTNKYGIVIVKNGIDTSKFTAKPIKETHDIVFVGNLGYPPNKQAVIVINSLAKKRPNWSFLIAGARSEALDDIDLSSNITLSGWVDDIRDAYGAGRIFLAPIHHGSGLQNKILEAMSLVRPCVTTSFVNDAIQADKSNEIIIADSIPEMEQSVIDLLSNVEKRGRLAQAGHDFVRDQFSWEEHTKPLVDFILNKQA